MLCTRAGVLSPAFTVVRSFHFPPVPVVICGGAVNDSRDVAISPDGQESETLVSARPSVSLPLHSTLALAGLRPAPRTTSWSLSPASSSDTSWLLQFHNKARAEAGRSGVMLTGSPPLRGRVYTSPPVEPKSLMRPAMNATVVPSRETLGEASC